MFNHRRFAFQSKVAQSIIYQIIYNLNGGVFSSNPPYNYNLQQLDLDLPTPNRQKFSFLGWSETNNFNNKNYLFTIPFGETGDKTYYARWKLNMTKEDVSSNVDINELIVEASEDINQDGVYDNFGISMTAKSGMEKLNFTLNNLIPNQKYSLYYTESNDGTPGNTYAGYKTAIYGSFVNNTKQVSTDSPNQSVSLNQNGLIGMWSGGESGSMSAIDKGLWQGPRDMELKFTATANTMYWIWDFGAMQDTFFNTYIEDILLEPISPEIKFSSLTLKDGGDLATFTIKEADESRGVFTFEFDGNSGVEGVYIPITGLAKNATYTLTFEHKFIGKFINGEGGTYDYGCGILNSPEDITLAAKMSNFSTKWISNTWTMNTVSNNIEKVTLTFTPTTDTVYWVWNMGNVSDSTIATITLNITNFNIKYNSTQYHFIGGV